MVVVWDDYASYNVSKKECLLLFFSGICNKHKILWNYFHFHFITAGNIKNFGAVLPPPDLVKVISRISRKSLLKKKKIKKNRKKTLKL